MTVQRLIMNTNGILDLCRKTQSQTEILRDEGLTELAVYSYTHSYTHTHLHTLENKSDIRLYDARWCAVEDLSVSSRTIDKLPQSLKYVPTRSAFALCRFYKLWPIFGLKINWCQFSNEWIYAWLDNARSLPIERMKNVSSLRVLKCLNRPFAADHSRGTKLLCWRARNALGEDKKGNNHKMMWALCLSCPRVSLP